MLDFLAMHAIQIYSRNAIRSGYDQIVQTTSKTVQKVYECVLLLFRFIGSIFLHMGAIYNWPRCIQVLVFCGVPVDGTLFGRTPLMNAARDGNVAAVRALIQAGAQLEYVDEDGFSPLYEAILYRHSEVIKVLVNEMKVSGSSFFGLNKSGKTFLQIAKIFDKSIYKWLKGKLDQSVVIFTKKIQTRKILAHVFHLEGSSEVFDIHGAKYIIKHEGWNSEAAFPVFAKCSRSFLKGVNPDIADAFVDNGDKDLIRRYFEGKPIVIKTGYSGHFSAVVLWKHVLVLSDRGGYLPKTCRVKEIRNEEVTEEFISELKTYRTNEEYKLFIDKLFESEDLAKGNSLAFPKQTVGNCVYANLEASFFTLLFLSEHLKDEKNWNTILDEQLKVLTNWRLFIEKLFIDKYLRLYPLDNLESYSYDELLTHVKFLCKIVSKILAPQFFDRVNADAERILNYLEGLNLK